MTASWDKTVKVWDNTYMKLMHTFIGHKAQINSIDMVNNFPYLASGSHDGQIMVWNLVEGKHLASYEYDSPVNCVIFSQKLYWVIVGCEDGIKVFDLPSKENILTIKETSLKPNELHDSEAKGESKKSDEKFVSCTSLAWNKSDDKLYAGFSDNYIRVYQIEELSMQAQE